MPQRKRSGSRSSSSSRSEVRARKRSSTRDRKRKSRSRTRDRKSRERRRSPSRSRSKGKRGGSRRKSRSRSRSKGRKKRSRSRRGAKKGSRSRSRKADAKRPRSQSKKPDAKKSGAKSDTKAKPDSKTDAKKSDAKKSDAKPSSKADAKADAKSTKASSKRSPAKRSPAKRSPSREKYPAKDKDEPKPKGLARAFQAAITGLKKPRKGGDEPAKVPEKAPMICAHPECKHQVNSDSSVSDCFCCGKCAMAFFAEPRGASEHGKRCELKAPPDDAKRATATSSSRADFAWGSTSGKGANGLDEALPDTGEKGEKKGKGDKKGDRKERKTAATHFPEPTPEELDLRRKRASRFGVPVAAEVTPAVDTAAAPAADKATSSADKAALDSKEKKGGDLEKDGKKKGLRAWSDDEEPAGREGSAAGKEAPAAVVEVPEDAPA